MVLALLAQGVGAFLHSYYLVLVEVQWKVLENEKEQMRIMAEQMVCPAQRLDVSCMYEEMCEHEYESEPHEGVVAAMDVYVHAPHDCYGCEPRVNDCVNEDVYVNADEAVCSSLSLACCAQGAASLLHSFAPSRLYA